ncbi:MAG: hypothetical protein IJ604_01600 [Prevotella sp.]|nr:hypothetical protein [Prevotella sp.]
MKSEKFVSATWPEDLLRIFEDPLFANVHPRVPKPTEEEVVRDGFRVLCQWSSRHQGAAPRMDKRNRDEWLLARRLQGIIEDDARREMLRAEDEYKLLDTVYDER